MEKQAEQEVKILNNGLAMPLLGIGTFNGFRDDKPITISQAVCQAIKIGYRHIDCAYAYNNETEIGAAIKEAEKKYKLERSQLFITSKLWNEFHKSEDVEPALKQSLLNLGLDYLDLYLMHWPFAFERKHQTEIHPVDFSQKFVYDIETHFTQTWQAMETMVEKGLVKAIGVSNFNEDQLQILINNCKVKPAVNQIECHPYLNQGHLIAFCSAQDIQVTAYSPLGCQDRIWSSPNDVQTPLLQNPILIGLSKKHGKSVAQIILKWQIQREIAVVPRMRTPEHIRENFRLWGDWQGLSDADMAEIQALNKDNRLYLPLIEGQPWCSDHPLYPFKINSV